MLIKDLMTTKVLTVDPETKVPVVAKILHDNHFTGVPVVQDGRVIGTISESDFISANSDLYLPTYITMLSSMEYVQGAKKNVPDVVNKIINATAKDIMNQDVPFAKPDMTLEQVAKLFAEKSVNPIPVTDNENKLLGIVSRSDMIKFFTPSGVKDFYVDEKAPVENPHPKLERDIDAQVVSAQEEFASQFAYVAKARANIWVTAAIVLFIVGFIGGIIYVADPNIFSNSSSNSENFYKTQAAP